MPRAAATILAFVVPLTLVACSRKQPEIDGLGDWRFGKTTAKDAVKCQPENGMLWCFELPVPLGTQQAEPNLYFASSDPDAPLIEILLSISGCQVPELSKWLDDGIGTPSETRDGRRYYARKKIFVAAQVPAEPGRCEVSFVAASDTARITALKAK